MPKVYSNTKIIIVNLNMLQQEARTNSFKVSGSQRLILVVGMIRSGSTWLYNAIRLIVSHSGEDVYSCWIDDFDQSKAGSASDVLIKLHAVDESLAGNADLIFTCHRDLRDVALSILDVGWAQNEKELMQQLEYAKECHSYWVNKNTLNVAYGSICNKSIETLRLIAEKLGVNYSDKVLEGIVSEIDAMTVRPSEKGYDPVNLVHTNHRSDGKPGRWHDSANSTLMKKIESKHGSWLREFGYLPAAPVISVLGSPGYLTDDQTQTCSELIRCAGNNTGNLVFQHAINILLDTEKKTVGAAGIGYGDPEAFRLSNYLVFPAANLLRPGVDFRPLAGFIKNSPVPLIILGLGSQADALLPADESIQNIASDENVKILADAIQSRAAFVSVRGAFSQRVCEALNIKNTSILGCPSLLLNPSPTLGVEIERKLVEAKQKAHEGSIKIAVSAAAPFEIHNDVEKLSVERKLFRWAFKYRGLYVQQSGGEDAINFARQKYSDVSRSVVRSIRKILAPDISTEKFVSYSKEYQRLFIDARVWAEQLKSLDVVLGTRMHGNMIALAGGVPCIHIAHDARTSELVETMQLPYVSMEDVLECEDLELLLGRVKFNPLAFDNNRKNIAKLFSEKLNELGVPLASSHYQLYDN